MLSLSKRLVKKHINEADQQLQGRQIWGLTCLTKGSIFCIGNGKSNLRIVRSMRINRVAATSRRMSLMGTGRGSRTHYSIVMATADGKRQYSLVPATMLLSVTISAGRKQGHLWINPDRSQFLFVGTQSGLLQLRTVPGIRCGNNPVLSMKNTLRVDLINPMT